jgi:hypothetical protein
MSRNRAFALLALAAVIGAAAALWLLRGRGNVLD